MTTEPFAMEISIALEDIDTLTKDESTAIINVMNWCGDGGRREPEPLSVFLALHARLSYVLASPHGREFCAALRAWGANELIDARLWKHWRAYYRPTYRAAVAIGLDLSDIKTILESATSSHLICARPSAFTEEATTRLWEDLAARVSVGDILRYRYETWPTDKVEESELVRISSRGTLWVRQVGSQAKTLRSITRANFKWGLRVIEVRKGDAGQGAEPPMPQPDHPKRSTRTPR
jgi:hypothetical protein